MLVVYVAGPFTHPEPSENVVRAMAAADAVWTLGHVPYIPHLNYYWDIATVQRSYEDWLAYDMVFLGRCDVLLRLPGYSPGADREIAEAERLGIPVVYSLEELTNLEESLAR